MATLVRDRVRSKEDVIQLQISTTLQSAKTTLANAPDSVAIILGIHGLPVTLITAADLETIEAAVDTPLGELLAKLPPGLFALAEASLDEFVQSREFPAMEAGARGAIVFKGAEWLGVLTEETIDRYLDEEYKPVGITKSLSSWQAALAGDIITKPIQVSCEDFNHPNELEAWPEESPQCESSAPYPHPIWH